ncbi:MAG TPA: hypothetical protein VGJ06_12825 [Candidatus Acidoferrum sp.]|jgi:hypothetical protein
MSVKSTVALFGSVPLAAVLVITGCSGEAASVRQEKARALASAAPRQTVAASARAPEHFAKPAPRNPIFAKYTDPENGVSFRYPRNFALLDSADEDADSDHVISWQQAKETGAGVRTADELSADDPGATLIATIVVPDDAYPNTSFAGGSLQFAINRYQTAGTCRSGLLARQGDAKGASGTVTAQGVTFAWIDIDTGDGNTEFSERDYAGFANDACYEFFVRVGVGSAMGAGTVQNVSASGVDTDADSGVNGEESASYRRPDERKIVTRLEKIVGSVQVEAGSASLLDKPRYKASPAPFASN